MCNKLLKEGDKVIVQDEVVTCEECGCDGRSNMMFCEDCATDMTHESEARLQEAMIEMRKVLKWLEGEDLPECSDYRNILRNAIKKLG